HRHGCADPPRSRARRGAGVRHARRRSGVRGRPCLQPLLLLTARRSRRRDPRGRERIRLERTRRRDHVDRELAARRSTRRERASRSAATARARRRAGARRDRADPSTDPVACRVAPRTQIHLGRQLDDEWHGLLGLRELDLDRRSVHDGRDPKRTGHIRIFEAWANAEHTLVWVYEETPPRVVHRVIVYDDRYQPIRLSGLSSAGEVRLIPGTPAPTPTPRPATTRRPTTA